LDKTIRPEFQNDGFLALADGAGVACATAKNQNIHELSGLLDSNLQPSTRGRRASLARGRSAFG